MKLGRGNAAILGLTLCSLVAGIVYFLREHGSDTSSELPVPRPASSVSVELSNSPPTDREAIRDRSEREGVYGRIEVLSESDSALFSGEMIVIPTGGDLPCRRVAINDGQWEMPYTAAQCYEVGDIVLNGTPCRALTRPLCVIDDEIPVVHVDVRDVRLHLRSASTGQSLSGVIAHKFDGQTRTFRSAYDHPLSARIQSPEIPLGDSPVQPTVTGSLLVGVDGYEWTRALLAPDGCVPREVFLHATGSLILRIESGDPHALVNRLRLELRSEESPTTQDVPPTYCVTIGTLPVCRIGAIRPGNYTAQVVRGEAPVEPQVLASGAVKVIEGEVAELSVAIKGEADTGTRAQVAGVVYIGIEDDLLAIDSIAIEPFRVKAQQDPVVFAIEHGADARARRTEFGVEWAPIQLAVGSYVLKIKPIGYVISFSVAPGQALMELTLPPARAVGITAKSPDGSLVPQIDYVWVQSGEDGEVLERTGWSGASGVWENPSVVQVRGRVARIKLGTRGVGDAIVSVGTADQSVVVTLRPSIRHEVRIAAGSTPIPIDVEWWKRVRLEQMDGGPGHLEGIEFDWSTGPMPAAATFIVSAAGEYRMRFPVIGQTPSASSRESSVAIAIGPVPTATTISASMLRWPVDQL